MAENTTAAEPAASTGHPAPGPPPEFVARLERLLPPQRLAAWWQAYRASPYTTFRVNTLKASPATVLAELAQAGIVPEPLPWWALGFMVGPAHRRPLTETRAFAAGRLYIQNAASMWPPLLLAPRPADWVLDLTAAPGSKTLQLAALMENQGRISAVEQARARFHRLRRNLAQGGATNVQTYRRDGAAVWHVCPERFDRVLLDAPCSADGRFRADVPANQAGWSVKRVRDMARRQRRLLFSAVQCLKPGGVLVYSTCTLAPEENEGVVHWALRRFGEALVVEPLGLPLANQLPGIASWNGHALAPALGHARRLLPDHAMEGFFLCRLRKAHTTLSQPEP